MSIQLQHKQQFEELLADYHVSAEAKAMLREVRLAILLGISGAGRNTIINHLVNSGQYHFIVSSTTRPPKLRDGRMEVDGVNYHFIGEDEMLENLQTGAMLEAELIHEQQVSGISIAELERAAQSGKIPINEVDIGGTEAIKDAKPDTNFFFVVPPTYKEWMYRLHGREVISEGEVANRKTTGKRILSDALSNDTFTFVVNDSSHGSAELIDNTVRTGEAVDDSEARNVARVILEELTASTH